MRSSSSWVSLFALTQALGLATGLALEARDTCHADNCLRAVRATAYGSATAASRRADCQSFLDFTLTPATSISTSTITAAATFTPLTVTFTNTAGETDITTPPTETATYTSTVTNTLTPGTVTITATTTATALTTPATSTDLTTTNPTFTTTPAEVFITSTIVFTTQVSTTVVVVTVTDYSIHSSSALKKRAIEARQTIRTPSLVPSYASACSGTAHYSSACLCDGVSPVTATAASPISVVYTTVTNTQTVAAPVTTVTVTSTTDIATVAPIVTTSTVETDAVTVATPTSVATTIETDTITLPAPTTTITITVTSTTVEPTPSTTIFSSVATSTVTMAHSTVTVDAVAVVPAFSIQINSGTGQQCNGQFVNTPASNGQSGSESNCGTSTVFNIDQFGYLHFGTTNIIAIQQTIGGFQDFRFLPISDVGPDFVPCTCSITGTTLHCNCFYGSQFYISGSEILVGATAAGTAFTPVVVPA